MRNPLERMGIPQPWRTIIDWVFTIVGAIAIVLAIKAWVVNPYRIPSSSMEPTLHCARPDQGCEAHFSDRVLACRFCFRIWGPKRGEIIVFHTPPLAKLKCGAGGTFVKRLIGLPGDTVYEDDKGFLWITAHGSKRAHELNEPYVLSNGDLPAMLVVDAVARRLPGALSESSGEVESFSAELGGALEYPHFTRPAEFRGWTVPDVLLSGDHAKVDRWRKENVR